MATCDKPAVGRFHYIDRRGKEHAAEPLCSTHAAELYSTPEPTGTARSHGAPEEDDTCEAAAAAEE